MTPAEKSRLSQVDRLPAPPNKIYLNLHDVDARVTHEGDKRVQLPPLSAAEKEALWRQSEQHNNPPFYPAPMVQRRALTRARTSAWPHFVIGVLIVALILQTMLVFFLP